MEVHRTEISGVRLTFYDTRGIGYSPEETRRVLDEIRRKFSSLDIDLFLICIKLSERLTKETLHAIRDIKEVYGKFFLQRCIVVCTFTNAYEEDVKRDEPNISKQELVKAIQEEVRFVSSEIQNAWRDVPSEAYSEIPFINVGLRNTNDSIRGEEELKLSTSDNWIHDFFVVCSGRCPEQHLEPLKKVADKCVPFKHKVAYAAAVGGAGAILGGAVGMLFFPGAGLVIGSTLGAELSLCVVGAGAVGGAGVVGGVGGAVGWLKAASIRKYFIDMFKNV